MSAITLLMPSPRADRALLALAFGFVLLTAALLSSIWPTQRQQNAFGMVTHTLGVEQELSKAPSEVQNAADGQQALAAIPGHPRIDLLFTDIIMAGMTSRRPVDEVRETRPELKVLYTTGYTRNAVVHNGVLDANVAFLPKPFTVAQLAARVGRTLDGGRANRTQ